MLRSSDQLKGIFNQLEVVNYAGLQQRGFEILNLFEANLKDLKNKNFLNSQPVTKRTSDTLTWEFLNLKIMFKITLKLTIADPMTGSSAVSAGGTLQVGLLENGPDNIESFNHLKSLDKAFDVKGDFGPFDGLNSRVASYTYELFVNFLFDVLKACLK